MKDGVFPFGKKMEGLFYFLKKNLSIRCEDDTSGISFEKNSVQIVFKFFNGAADGRLADI